jgi:hypothetical protein
MFVDINRGGEQIQVNIDILLSRLPCDIVSLDAQDIMGTHIVNVGGQLFKKRIREGRVLSEEVHTYSTNAQIHQQSEHHDDHQHNQVDMARLKKAFDEKEGCQLVGSIIVNKVPGTTTS